MKMSNWAEREVELAKKKGDEYYAACADSALRAFKTLLKDNHSGFSINVAKSILNSLIDGRPLTPIEDTPDVWEYSYTQDDGTTVYHCVRQSSLFKDVKPDGSVRYSDVDRFSNHELISDTYWHSGLITKIGEELHPINMHYIAYSNSFIIVTRECLYDEKNGDYDTIEVIQIHTPDGKKRDIQRYFREPNEGEEATYRGWVEIDEPEWLERWENRKR